MNLEADIQNDVEALRNQFSETRALYREVCALLFFRYGITPTAGKLYQYVRKGSMSTPAEALAKFWEELRGKARVELDHPGLPDALKAMAAEAIGTLWQQATATARDELATLRLEIQAQLQQAQVDLTLARRDAEESRTEADELRLRWAASQDETRQVQSELEAERRASAAEAARAQELQRQVEALGAQIEAARADFTAELAKGRAAIDAATERATAAERRALLDIDQERQARSKADKLAQTLRVQLAEVENSLRAQALEHASASARSQQQLDAARQDGQRLTEAHAQQAEQLLALQGQLTQAERGLLQHQTEAQTLRSLMQSQKSAAPVHRRASRRANVRTVKPAE